MMVSKFELSNYIHAIERYDGVLIYHTLFGAPILLSKDDYFNLINGEYIENRPFRDSYLFEYLRKNFFIIPEGYEEFNIIIEEIREREIRSSSGYLFRQLQLMMSHSCNFRCSYCYEKDMNIKNTSDIKNNSNNMPFHIADKAISDAMEITKMHGNELFIEFFGGEPLVNWKVIKQIFDKFENGEKFNSQISYSITTNGSLINKEIADYFKKYRANITISLDSLENKERRYANGKSTSKDVLEKIALLKLNKNYVTINSTISKETYDSFNSKELIDFSIENNIQMIGLILDLDVNTYSKKEYRTKVIDSILDAYNYGNKRGIRIVGYWHQIFNQIIGNQLLPIVTGYKTCPATGCKLSIEPDGSIFVCKGPQKKIGHVDDFKSCFISPNYNYYVRSLYKTNGNCRHCELEGFCSGVCMGSLEKKYNDIYRIENSTCLIYKELITKLLKQYEIN